MPNRNARKRFELRIKIKDMEDEQGLEDVPLDDAPAVIPETSHGTGKKSSSTPWGWIILGVIALVVAVSVVLYFVLWHGKGKMSVRISRPLSLPQTDDLHHLHVGEIEVYNSDNKKMTLQCADPCQSKSGQHGDLTPQLAIDGKPDTTTHSKFGEGTKYGSEEHFLHFNIDGYNRKSDIKKVIVIHSHSNPDQLRRLNGCILELIVDGKRVWHVKIDTSAAVVGTGPIRSLTYIV